jgi:SAM-dependent methyltransferase
MGPILARCGGHGTRGIARFRVSYGPPVTEPARWGLRRRLLNLLDRLRLARPAVRAYELMLATRSERNGSQGPEPGGLPLPPARLRVQAGPAHADAEFFLRSGQEHSDLIRALLAEHGSSVQDLDALLDWGCGCGRVLRHWSGLSHTGVYGCDINPKMVEWCAAELGFADVRLTGLEPPLPYPDSSFDLVYAFSVLTHLPEDLQHAWMRECFRVLKPEGQLLISTMGEHYVSLERLSESERRSFESGDVVVLYDRSAGTSLCSAYHPHEYVRDTLASEFDVLAFLPASDGGRHDLHLLRKPARIRVSAEHS